MSLLVLGGTTEGRSLALALHRRELPVIYSLAGLVRETRLACKVISGGFSQHGGLDAYIEQHGIQAVLDATHPYAVHISRAAVGAARRRGIPCWRYHRPAWQAQAGDQWYRFPDWTTLIGALADKRAVFLTTGQPTADMLALLSTFPAQRQWLRTAVPPAHPLPRTMGWVQDIGPFSLENERALLERHRIDALVSKNSGGEATSAKLQAARELKIPVYLLERPTLPPATRLFHNLDDCEETVARSFGQILTSLAPIHLNPVVKNNEEYP